jgi:hypothetical protein
MDPNGICVIKKFISINNSNYIKGEILKKIMQDINEIIRNCFGNYIIQFIIDEWQEIICEDIILFVINNLKSLLIEKFSSKVIQKIVDLIGKVNFFIFIFIFKSLFINYLF